MSHSKHTTLTHTSQTHKDIPAQLISSSTTLAASLIFASFGSSKPYHSPAFALNIALDPSAPRAVPESPLRYGKLPAIHHIFKTDPRSPPKFITIVFTAAVLAAVPTLAGLVGFRCRESTPMLTLRSGYLWEPTPTTCRRLLVELLSPTFCSSVRFLPWRASSSCTIARGIYFRHCLQQPSSEP